MYNSPIKAPKITVVVKGADKIIDLEKANRRIAMITMDTLIAENNLYFIFSS
jgi:hypothetical protein